jgi:hypothetical protein
MWRHNFMTLAASQLHIGVRMSMAISDAKCGRGAPLYHLEPNTRGSVGCGLRSRISGPRIDDSDC